MSEYRIIPCVDAEFKAMRGNLENRKEELKKINVPWSFGGMAICLQRAFHAGKIPVSVLKGMKQYRAHEAKK